MKVDRVNYYRVGNRWSYSAWAGYKCVATKMLAAKTPEEARAEVEALFPDAAILRLPEAGQ